MATHVDEQQSDVVRTEVAKQAGKDVLTVLGVRGFPLLREEVERITTCTDPDQLKDWLREAVTLDRIDHLFTEPPPLSLVARRIARTTADSVISVLGGRGLTVTDDVKQRIKSSTDIEQLAEWLKRSLSVSGAEELFQEPV